MTDTSAKPGCLNCGSPFAEDEISPKRRFAVCSQCGSLHNVATFFPTRAQRPMPLRMPYGIQFAETMNEGVLQVSSRQPKKFNTGLMVAAVGLTVAYMTLSLGSNLFAAKGMSAGVTFLSAGLIAMVVVAVVAGILMVQGSTKTRIRVDKEGIESTTTPFRSFEPSRYPLETLRGVIAMPSLTSPARFELHAIVGDLLHQRLVRGTLDYYEAHAAVYLLNKTVNRLRPDAVDVEEKRHDRLRKLKRTSGTAIYAPAHKYREKPPESVELACQACGAPIPLSRIRRSTRSASCDYCGVVRDVHDFLKVPRPAQSGAEFLPENLEMQVLGNRIKLWVRPESRERSRTERNLIIGIVAIGGLMFLSWLGMIATKRAEFLLVALIAMFVAPLALAGIAWILWRRQRFFTDGYNIMFDDDGLIRQQRFGRSDFDFGVLDSEVRAFYAVEYLVDEEDADDVAWGVIVEQKDGQRFTVASDLNSPLYALTIAEQFDQIRSRLV